MSKNLTSRKFTTGKLIVIDGTDGSGKATQVAELAKHLRRDGKKVKIIDFPDYYNHFFGAFIGHCLSEQYYNFINTHPKIASVLYAADRFEAKDDIEKWLKAGYVVIANRYVSANQIHQGGKIKDARKRVSYLQWLDEMEYKVFKIPRPDIVVYLSLPIPLTKKLIASRNKTGQSRAYLRNKNDLAEYNTAYLENSRKSALWLSKHEKHFKKIECAEKGAILPISTIHERVYKEVVKVLSKSHGRSHHRRRK